MEYSQLVENSSAGQHHASASLILDSSSSHHGTDPRPLGSARKYWHFYRRFDAAASSSKQPRSSQLMGSVGATAALLPPRLCAPCSAPRPVLLAEPWLSFAFASSPWAPPWRSSPKTCPNGAVHLVTYDWEEPKGMCGKHDFYVRGNYSEHAMVVRSLSSNLSPIPSVSPDLMV